MTGVRESRIECEVRIYKGTAFVLCGTERRLDGRHAVLGTGGATSPPALTGQQTIAATKPTGRMKDRWKPQTNERQRHKLIRQAETNQQREVDAFALLHRLQSLDVLAMAAD